MEWYVSEAKNGESTLHLNNVAIYSKYRPFDDAMRWILAEVDDSATHYLLIGLGLGYHLRALAECVGMKPITVYYFNELEYELFQQYNTNWWQQVNIRIVSHLEDVLNNKSLQLLVPNVWIKAIGSSHPLHNLLEIIRLKQVSYKRAASIMGENIRANILLGDPSFQMQMQKQERIACLVAAGPSLNDTINWLKQVQQKVDIYAVGAALKVLDLNGILPKAVVHADSSPKTIRQFEQTKFNGEFYYLSTASSLAVVRHKGPRFILMQQGYDLAEKYAEEKLMPLLKTGGSVGTVTFSLIEALGYDTVILFGQDLGYSGNETHAKQAPSNNVMNKGRLFKKIIANDGSEINTGTGLFSFLNWYNAHCQQTNMRVFNTAVKGAKIKNVPLIDEQQFYDLINQL